MSLWLLDLNCQPFRLVSSCGLMLLLACWLYHLSFYFFTIQTYFVNAHSLYPKHFSATRLSEISKKFLKIQKIERLFQVFTVIQRLKTSHCQILRDQTIILHTSSHLMHGLQNQKIIHPCRCNHKGFLPHLDQNRYSQGSQGHNHQDWVLLYFQTFLYLLARFLLEYPPGYLFLLWILIFSWKTELYQKICDLL